MNAVANALKKKKKKKSKRKDDKPKQTDNYVSEPEDYSDHDSEDQESYKKGGYHPVQIGNKFKNRYTVLRKLGWGHFSTVWLAHDYVERRLVALKIQKSASHYTEAALDEIELLSQIREKDPDGIYCCCQLLDHFSHTGPNGKHMCMVFEVLGENALSLIKRYKYRGLPLGMVKTITRQVLVALDYIHTTLEIIHTDLKPENVLIAPANEEQMEMLTGISSSYLKTLIGPPSTASLLNEIDTSKLTKNQKKRLKQKMKKQQQKEQAKDGDPTGDAGDDDDDVDDALVVAQSTADDKEAGPSLFDMAKKGSLLNSFNDNHEGRVKLCDFGNSCWTFKQFTSDIQTRQYRCPEVIIGCKYSTPADIWSLACFVFELCTGELLFDAKSGQNYDRNEDHIAQIIELVGDFPSHMIKDGNYANEYFTKQGDLKHIKDLKRWPLSSVLVEKYEFKSADAKELEAFLVPMLTVDPAKRVTARQALRHEWLVTDSSHAADDITDNMGTMTINSDEVSI
eukprot:GFYU01007028.1.p1 GENE.GFYU01007028.1~~GFYU01007028.1.p1  ORF type:complete len:510 (+),score=123.09 GFYU01007028.1:21-1550(+)